MDRNSSGGIPDALLDTSIDDGVFRALVDRTRRYSLYLLLDRRSMSTSELADVLTGWLHAAGYGLADSDDRERLRAELYHVHLPTLVDAELVECDERFTVVELAPLRGPVVDLLEWSRAYERRPGNSSRTATGGPDGEP
jgi:hypothetical protein